MAEDEPTSLGHTDLSDAFAPPDRTKGLRKAGLKRSTVPQEALNQGSAVLEADEPQPPSEPTTEAAEKNPRKSSETTPRRQTANGAVVVYMPVPVHERLKLARQSHTTSQTDIVLDAIEQAYERLSEIVTNALTPACQTEGRLFTRVQQQTQDHQPKVQVTIRPTADQLQIIDELVTTHGAPDRSFFISTVLDDVLPSKQRKRS